MKILLIGEYSNVHWTLANGLRRLGHQVTVASSGDQFKGYCRDIDLTRKRLSAIGGVQYLLNTAWHFRQFRGYDVVQIVNPIFLDMKPQRILPFFSLSETQQRQDISRCVRRRPLLGAIVCRKAVAPIFGIRYSASQRTIAKSNRVAMRMATFPQSGTEQTNCL